MKTATFKNFVRQPYAWPGMYPKFAICIDGGFLCKKCATENAKRIIRSIRDLDHTGWQVEAIDINWEDTSLYCDHCGKPIESAYGE